MLRKAKLKIYDVLVDVEVEKTAERRLANEAQPDKFASIPETLWWGVVTLTTIGYGDVYPMTGAGKVIGGVFAVLGIGLFALPAGILASGFSEELRKQQHKSRKHQEPPD